MKVESEAEKNIVDRLSQNWSIRAAVRNEEYVEDPEPAFHPDMYDFPYQLLPFRNHPAYVELEDPIQRKVQALAWIAWNKRVVDTEELLVGPALMTLMNGASDLSLKGNDRTAIRQTMIDEFFHSHMHEVAVGITCRGRDIPAEVLARLNRPACSYRSYATAAQDMAESWQKDVARIAWVVVGELSIYEFLRLVSEDVTIQPSSRTLLRLHERDEAAHASVIAQVMRDHFHEFSEKQKAHFVKCLPMAMSGFSQEDWLVWQDILELSGVGAARNIVSDIQNDCGVPDQLPLLRSFQKIEDFCSDIEIDIAASLQ